jgi:hypothetical protein
LSHDKNLLKTKKVVEKSLDLNWSTVPGFIPDLDTGKMSKDLLTVYRDDEETGLD